MTVPQVDVREYSTFADSQWHQADGRQFFDVHEPYSGKLFARVAAGSRADARVAVDAASKAFAGWSQTTPSEKARLFLKASEIVKRRRSEIAEVLARETGSTISFATFQQDLVAATLQQVAGWVFLPKGEVLETSLPGTHSIGVRRPLGVVASFTPWNGANVLSWRAVISPVAAGNTVVVKPSEFAPVSAGVMLAEVAEEAGFPAGVINVVTHAPGAAGAIADEFFDRPEVRVINLIGGVKTARMLAERAGRTLKRTVLELGGFNPMIILDDVDMEYAVRTATFGSFFHQGQICLNTRRIIIQRGIYEEFLRTFVARTKELPAGDPLDPHTIIGPIITRDAVKTIDDRVKEAIARGARAHTGAKYDGQIYFPTILTDVPLDAAIANEETFGPVVVVEVVDTPEEAIAAANRTLYGLTSSILAGNTYRAFEMAPKVLSGIVNVNSPTVNDEIHAPMGGVRDSGWGRTGPRSLDDFSDVIWINSHSGQRQYPVLTPGDTKVAKASNQKERYDFIVVGAGAAGSVLAAELSASGAQVLVIESGGPDDAPTIANPSIWFYNVGGPLDYHLPINPSPRLNNRKFNMALGHVLGGGTSINAMVWMRGMERDYDGWAKNGAKGWSFADVLPVFKRQEDWEGGANTWRGAGGPIHIRRPKDPHPTAPAFLDAARQMGMPILDDVNGPMRPGAGYINMNIAADGTRVSAVRAFLRPALSRPNLSLLLNSNVVKLNFTGTRCVGVRLMTDGALKDMAADKEVILAAGAINSPKLLMLSGVGEARALRSLGIDVVENLPGVGANLQDHVLVSGVVFKYKGKMPDRPADSNAVEAEAYLSSSPSGDTDISLVLHQLPAVTPEVASRFGTPPADALTIAPALVQPTSKGSVRLASDNFQDAAVIDGNYLGTDHDFAAVVRAIEAARELGSQHAFDSVRESELIPGPKASAEEIRELATLASASFGHAVGTCKMGVDPLAVVDPELRVHDVLGLRVADASVMPQIITGPGTNASAHMIAGRAAQLILGHHA